MTTKRETSADDATGSAPAAVAAAVQELSLQEFCGRLSEGDNKRVELIGAFHHSETAAGTVKGTESALQERFDAFVNKPVEG